MAKNGQSDIRALIESLPALEGSLSISENYYEQTNRVRQAIEWIVEIQALLKEYRDGESGGFSAYDEDFHAFANHLYDVRMKEVFSQDKVNMFSDVIGLDYDDIELIIGQPMTDTAGASRGNMEIVMGDSIASLNRMVLETLQSLSESEQMLFFQVFGYTEGLGFLDSLDMEDYETVLDQLAALPAYIEMFESGGMPFRNTNEDYLLNATGTEGVQNFLTVGRRSLGSFFKRGLVRSLTLVNESPAYDDIWKSTISEAIIRSEKLFSPIETESAYEQASSLTNIAKLADYVTGIIASTGIEGLKAASEANTTKGFVKVEKSNIETNPKPLTTGAAMQNPSYTERNLRKLSIELAAL